MYTSTKKEIGKGSFSIVYEAVSVITDRKAYALKELKSYSRESDKKRFIREAEILSNLHHENIIDVVFMDMLAPNPFFVMPKAKNNLSNAIKYDLSRRIDLPKVFSEICSAIIYAHSNEIIHRDLKPENVLITEDNQVKVSDFGLAKNFQLDEQSSLTTLYETGGTLPYAAPEQYDRSLKDVDKRADIYSLGKILYYIYTKKDPYNLELNSPHLTEAIYDIVKKATDSDRSKRYQTADDLLMDFNRSIPREHNKPTTISEPSSEKKYALVQFHAQALAIRGKSNPYHNISEIEKIATYLQRLIWKNKHILLPNQNSVDLLDILDPELAYKLLAFKLNRQASLGTFSSVGGLYEVAGVINQSEKTISISEQFDTSTKRFTEAHELGHALLHRQTKLHRDRPINGIHPQKNIPREEFEANKFATYFLMPKKQVIRKFHSIFGMENFIFSLETGRSLMLNDDYILFLLNHPNFLSSNPQDRRELARIIAATTQFRNRQVYSLSEFFRVSNEAMAIRLEELNLI